MYSYVPMKSFVKNPPLKDRVSSQFKVFSCDKITIRPHSTVKVPLGYSLVAPSYENIQLYMDPSTLNKGFIALPQHSLSDPNKEIKITLSSFVDNIVNISPGECLGRFVFARTKPNMVIIPQSRKQFAQPSADEPDWPGPSLEKKKKKKNAEESDWSAPSQEKKKTSDWDEKPASWDLEWSPERPQWESYDGDVADGATKNDCFD